MNEQSDTQHRGGLSMSPLAASSTTPNRQSHTEESNRRAEYNSNNSGGRRHRSMSPVDGSGSANRRLDDEERMSREDHDDPLFSRVYVNYPKKASRLDLFEAFSKFGYIQDIWMIYDQRTSTFKGLFNFYSDR